MTLEQRYVMTLIKQNLKAEKLSISKLQETLGMAKAGAFLSFAETQREFDKYVDICIDLLAEVKSKERCVVLGATVVPLAIIGQEPYQTEIMP